MKFPGIKYLSQRIKITVSKAHSDEELWHVHITRIACFATVLVILAVFVAGTVFMTLHTPLANYIPGFHGKKAQTELLKALHTLDSLTNEVGKWEAYNENLMLVLEGGTSVSNIVEAVDSIKKQNRKIVPRTILDSILRARIEQEDTLVTKNKRHQKVHRFLEMASPAQGMITSDFSIAEGRLGITMTPPPASAIQAVMDGTIISTLWDPSSGWTITMQHAGGLISIYKGLAKTIQFPGEKINAEEIIGLYAGPESTSTQKFEFELWLNGNAIDPEKYITF